MGNWLEKIGSFDETQNLILESAAKVLFAINKAEIQFSYPEIHLLSFEIMSSAPDCPNDFVPPIAYRWSNHIVYIYEILKEVAERISDNHEIEMFVRSIFLHEMGHIILGHNQGSQAEEREVNLWMSLNGPDYQEYFVKYMSLVDEVSENHKKS